MMKLSVVVENMCTRQGLLAEWGLALHLQTENHSLLLDTGGWRHVLLDNMRTLGIAPEKVDTLVLSHAHGDHTSGLMDITRVAPDLRLFASPAIRKPRFSDADKKRYCGGGGLFALPHLNPVEGFVEVIPNVWAFDVPLSMRENRFINTRLMWEENNEGERVTDTFEDDLSLLVKGDKGWTILLGCAHSGLPNILNRAREMIGDDPIYMVLGGTHLADVPAEEFSSWIDVLKPHRVQHWRPSHCTGFRAAAALSRVFDDVDWAGCGSQYSL